MTSAAQIQEVTTSPVKSQKFSFALKISPSIYFLSDLKNTIDEAVKPITDPSFYFVEQSWSGEVSTMGIGGGFDFKYHLSPKIAMGLNFGVSKISTPLIFKGESRQEFPSGEIYTKVVDHAYNNLSVTSVGPQIHFIGGGGSLSYYAGFGITIFMVSMESQRTEVNREIYPFIPSDGTLTSELILKATGSGLGFMIQSGIEFKLGKKLGLFAEAGLEMGSSKLSGTEVRNITGSGDYLGVDVQDSYEVVWVEIKDSFGSTGELFFPKEFISAAGVSEATLNISALRLGIGIRMAF